MEQEIKISKEEFEAMKEHMERMRETIEILSNEDTIKGLKEAIARIESGEFLTKEDMVFEDV